MEFFFSSSSGLPVWAAALIGVIVGVIVGVVAGLTFKKHCVKKGEFYYCTIISQILHDSLMLGLNLLIYVKEDKYFVCSIQWVTSVVVCFLNILISFLQVHKEERTDNLVWCKVLLILNNLQKCEVVVL